MSLFCLVALTQILHQLLSHCFNHAVVAVGVAGVGGAENGAAGNESVGAGAGDLGDVVHLDAAVDFQPDIAPAAVDELARLSEFAEGGFDEALAAEAGVDRHQQHHVHLVDDMAQRVQRGGRVKHQPGAAAALADQLQRAVDVRGGFRVEGDVTGAGGGEIGDDAVHRLDHEMHIDGGGYAVLAQGVAHRGAQRQVGNIVVVHHIEVHHIRAGGEHLLHFLPQPGEVGGQDRRGDEVFSHNACSARVPEGE